MAIQILRIGAGKREGELKVSTEDGNGRWVSVGWANHLIATGMTHEEALRGLDWGDA